MSTINSKEPSSLCAKYHKNLKCINRAVKCNSCDSKYHSCCTKNNIAYHRGSCYCHPCLKQKDLLKYNPYFEAMKHYVDDTEKTYLQNQISSYEIETLSPLYDIMETCEVYSIQEIESKPAHKNSIAYKFLNIDGNASNFDTFSVTLDAMKYKFSVIGISETNISSSQQDAYQLANYNSLYQDKIASKKKGSGVALYIHNSINFCKIHEYSSTTEDIETLFASISNNNNFSAVVGVVYRPPSGNITNFIKHISGIMSSLSKSKHKAIIMGDFNINMFSDNKHRSSFEDLILCNGFTPTISVATHVKPSCQFSCLDNILVNNTNDVIISGAIDTHVSHHRSVFLACSLPAANSNIEDQNINQKGKVEVKYDFCKENLIYLRKNLVHRLNVAKDSTYDEFLTTFLSCIDESCKLKAKKCSKRNKINNPWITACLMKSIRHRDNLYKKWKKSTSKLCKSGDPRLHDEYRRYRNTLSRLVKTVKQNYYTKKFELASGNLKQTWRLINQLRGKQKSSSKPYIKIHNSIITDKKDIANKFNNHFRSLAENLNKDLENRPENNSQNFRKYFPKSEESTLFLEED